MAIRPAGRVISYAGRDYSEGKKITWRDGVKAIVAVIRWRFFNGSSGFGYLVTPHHDLSEIIHT